MAHLRNSTQVADAMFTEIPADQWAAALDACAAEVLWEAGVTEPPVDAASVAERLGLVVAHNADLTCRGRLVELADPCGGTLAQGTIVLGPAERPERLQWAIAHEIGESVAYRVFASLGIRPVDAPDDAREQVANHLASCLLLPRHLVRRRWPAARLGPDRVETAIRDSEPRTHRPPDARNECTDRNHAFRSGEYSLAPNERWRPAAKVAAGRIRDLARCSYAGRNGNCHIGSGYNRP